MITNLEEALEQNKRLVSETFRVTQDLENTKAELIVLKSKMNSQHNGGNPFYRNIADREELIEKLTAMEAALQNSDELNLKFSRDCKQLNKKLADMEQQLVETTTQLSVTLKKLKAKEEENAGQKAKLAVYDNKEGMKQTIDELTTQLAERDSFMRLLCEETKVKEALLNESVEANKKLLEERNINCEKFQNMKVQQDYFKIYEQNLEQKLQQARDENLKMANIIFQHEESQRITGEKIQSLEHQLQAYKNIPMMQQPRNIQPPATIQQDTMLANMCATMRNLQMEIEHLKKPRK